MDRKLLSRFIDFFNDFINSKYIFREWKCSLSINGIGMSEAIARNKVVSRKATIEILLFNLQGICFTIEVCILVV